MCRLGEADPGAEAAPGAEEPADAGLDVDRRDGEALAAGAVTAIGTDAFGGVGTFCPLPVTVSFTDVTEVAVAAIGTCACSCAGCDLAVPTLHEAVPFLPQPELNLGFWLDGSVVRPRTTLVMFWPVAHTLTFHWAVWPRWTLVSSRCSLTHSWAPEEALAALEVPAALVVGAGEVVLDPVGVVEGLDPDVLPDGLVELGGGVVWVEADPLGAGLEVLGEGLGLCTGLHCWLVAPLTADVFACAVCASTACAAAAEPSDGPAWLEVTAVATPKLDADTTRNPPAARLTAGRRCGIRIKALPLSLRCFRNESSGIAA